MNQILEESPRIAQLSPTSKTQKPNLYFETSMMLNCTPLTLHWWMESDLRDTRDSPVLKIYQNCRNGLFLHLIVILNVVLIYFRLITKHFLVNSVLSTQYCNGAQFFRAAESTDKSTVIRDNDKQTLLDQIWISTLYVQCTNFKLFKTNIEC